ncbi:MAG: hypothetical protein ACR2OX_10475 [Methyloligellaceae bacterium]
MCVSLCFPFVVAAQVAPASPFDRPVASPGGQGPFRDMDLLAIGAVLVVVLLILGFRKIATKRPSDLNRPN